MFAKLFNNISPRNMLNAILVLLVLEASFWIYPFNDWQWYPNEAWPFAKAGAILGFILISSLSILLPLAFAESQNRRHAFRAQYLTLLLSGILCWIWLYPLNGGSQIWSVLLFAPLIFTTLPLLKPQASGSALVFISGFTIAIASFINAESTGLLLFVLIIMSAVRRLSGRTFLALVLGYGGALYFAFSLDFFLDWSLMTTWRSELQSIDFIAFSPSYKRLAILIPIGIFLFFSGLISFSQGSHYNNEQRKEINYWLFLALIGLSGFLLFNNSNFWLGLCLWPTAILGSLAIQGIKNPWLKDGLLILPFSAYLLAFFV
ncbi:MAG: DUF6427 family protein [Croceimicrobium sp.]